MGGAWDVFERVVNLPNPKPKLPLSPGTATIQAQRSMSLTAVLYVIQHKQMKANNKAHAYYSLRIQHLIMYNSIHNRYYN